MKLGLDEFFKSPTLETIIELYNQILLVDIYSIPDLSYTEKKVARTLLRNKVAHYNDYFSSHLEQSIQTLYPNGTINLSTTYIDCR